MDTVEATEMVMSRIKTIDPQNASKIMGYLLIQDQSENEMIRLAFGPENLLVSVIKQAKTFLDISSNTWSAPSFPFPFRHQTPPQIVIPSNGYNHTNHTPVSPHNNADRWRPCMQFDLGFCENNTSCKFVHGSGDGGFEEAIDGFQDLMRIKAMQQQRSSSSSRQIYLTFPADSTFTGEDVSNYFSMFGPVEDVRIPYQQKRMFGFVAFVYPESVKSVLANGNPHFICDSRVLVKPYKEKGSIPFKKHQVEPFDIPFGTRMFNHEGLDEYQQMIDFQERKLMNMRLTTEHHNLNVYGEEINGSNTQEVNDDDREINSSSGSYINERFCIQ